MSRETAQQLHAAIVARALGQEVQNAGASGRSMGFKSMKTSEMISLYQQIWSALSEADRAGLPWVDQLSASNGGPRVAPGRRPGRGMV